MRIPQFRVTKKKSITDYKFIGAGAHWEGRDSSVGIATRYGLDGPGIGEIFRSRPDRPWGPPSLLYNGYRVTFPGVKRPGRGVDHPPSSSARVKERVELYFYSPSGPSWPVLGRPLPLPLPLPGAHWNLKELNGPGAT
jgi:hypothetical protein